jgi:hypothetical protein
MALEPIRRLTLAEPDRARVQDEAIASATTRTAQHLAAYVSHPESFGGRYICADLFKATFPKYEASRESRDRYNNAVHNPAAVLAAEHFRQVLADPFDTRRRVEFLTGMPGAGKTTSVLVGGALHPEVRAIWEGQLWRPETTFPKVQQALDAGMKPTIVVVHTTPEVALRNTLKRFAELGRGASINTMADIQGGLPAGLRAVQERFGEQVQLRIVDRRNPEQPLLRRGWENLPVLESEGSREAIHRRLAAELERVRSIGLIGADAERQARGDSRAREDVRGMARAPGGTDGQAVQGQAAQALLRAKAFLSLRAEEAQSRFPELAPAYASLAVAVKQLNLDPTLSEEGRRRQLQVIREAAGARIYNGIAPSEAVVVPELPRSRGLER